MFFLITFFTSTAAPVAATYVVAATDGGNTVPPSTGARCVLRKLCAPRSLRAYPYPFFSNIAMDNTRRVEEPAVRLVIVREDSTTVAELEARKQAACDAASEFTHAAEDVRDRSVGGMASVLETRPMRRQASGKRHCRKKDRGAYTILHLFLSLSFLCI